MYEWEYIYTGNNNVTNIKNKKPICTVMRGERESAVADHAYTEFILRFVNSKPTA